MILGSDRTVSYTHLSWLFALAAVAIFAAFPRAMVVMARFLGIDAPVNMIFFLGFCFSLVIIYILTVSLSRMSTKMRRLTPVSYTHLDVYKRQVVHTGGYLCKPDL